MKQFLIILAIFGLLFGCHYHKHKHQKDRSHHEEHHHHYIQPETDFSDKKFIIEQDIDLHFDEMPNNG